MTLSSDDGGKRMTERLGRSVLIKTYIDTTLHTAKTQIVAMK